MGGFALSNPQVPIPFKWSCFQQRCCTFTANLSGGDVALPPAYDGETAFANGSIDTSEDTGSGRDSEPPYVGVLMYHGLILKLVRLESYVGGITGATYQIFLQLGITVLLP